MADRSHGASRAPGARGTLRVLTHFPAERLARAAQELPWVELVPIPTEGGLPAEASGDVLVTFAWGAPNVADAVAHGVRWVHAIGTGVDRFPFDALGGRVLTCARGASAVPISEWVLAMMLAFEKKLPESWIAARDQWRRLELGGLSGRTLGLLGLGSIGAAVATRALPFGMRVRAVRRSARPSPVEGVELVGDVRAVLSTADHLVLALPSTPATRHVIDAEALARVKHGLHLINVSRGTLVDQDALRAALDDGRVARASLDTVDPEPLPEGHWLYTHASVRLSPHASWSMPGALEVFVDTLIDNLRRWRAGEPLAGVVDVREGY
ncbi:MAG: NAD(P)-dependent oxidoreductase [Thermodesulfobacteriota bacterium]